MYELLCLAAEKKKQFLEKPKFLRKLTVCLIELQS